MAFLVEQNSPSTWRMLEVTDYTFYGVAVPGAVSSCLTEANFKSASSSEGPVRDRAESYD